MPKLRCIGELILCPLVLEPEVVRDKLTIESLRLTPRVTMKTFDSQSKVHRRISQSITELHQKDENHRTELIRLRVHSCDDERDLQSNYETL